ncbi:MAG: hypothetical protein U0172_10200 [Nitrospiraceae bacterium]
MRTEARTWTAAVLLGSLIATGCASTSQNSQGMAMGQMDSNERTSVYSTLDSTALVYTDPAAGAPADDNPIRWTGFLLHPVGLALDYAINRPLYTLASHLQRLTGYTAEDAMLDSSRRR